MSVIVLLALRDRIVNLLSDVRLCFSLLFSFINMLTLSLLCSLLYFVRTLNILYVPLLSYNLIKLSFHFQYHSPDI